MPEAYLITIVRHNCVARAKIRLVELSILIPGTFVMACLVRVTHRRRRDRGFFQLHIFNQKIILLVSEAEKEMTRSEWFSFLRKEPGEVNVRVIQRHFASTLPSHR
jgi:hypothetical protein